MSWHHLSTNQRVSFCLKGQSLEDLGAFFFTVWAASQEPLQTVKIMEKGKLTAPFWNQTLTKERMWYLREHLLYRDHSLKGFVQMFSAERCNYVPVIDAPRHTSNGMSLQRQGSLCAAVWGEAVYSSDQEHPGLLSAQALQFTSQNITPLICFTRPDVVSQSVQCLLGDSQDFSSCAILIHLFCLENISSGGTAGANNWRVLVTLWARGCLGTPEPWALLLPLNTALTQAKQLCFHIPNLFSASCFSQQEALKHRTCTMGSLCLAAQQHQHSNSYVYPDVSRFFINNERCNRIWYSINKFLSFHCIIFCGDE